MLTTELTEERIAALKEKNLGADLRVTEAEEYGRSYVWKVPRGPSWSQFDQLRNNEEQAPIALRTLVVSNMVDPTPAEFVAELDTLPGLVQSIGKPMVKAAGATSATVTRKL